MKFFTVYCPRTGVIIRTGQCQDHMVDRQARQGEGVLDIETNQMTDAIDLATLQVIPKPRVESKADYQMQRLRAYPPVGDQLDALWKALHGMPLTQEGEDMRQRIAAVKLAIPKDTK